MPSKRTSRRKANTYNVKCTMKDNMYGHKSGGAFYFLGFLGALIYYITTAPTLAEGIIGIFKALLWPAFLVHGAMVALAL